jgi:hypothetical protein
MPDSIVMLLAKKGGIVRGHRPHHIIESDRISLGVECLIHRFRQSDLARCD